ncbi:MAG: diguanylate cyclase [Proteobacteria bacterium]|nr:diguanylate cyclase [Pseudomonadota bacterium]
MTELNLVNHDELKRILAQLDQGLHNHQQWHNDIIRTLICRLPGDKHDMDPEAHKECRFGQWYYGDTPHIIADHQGFVALGDSHQNMHQLATRLLAQATRMEKIAPHEYDHFANSVEQLRLEIYSLKSELENLLFNHDPLTGAINRINMPSILREQQELSKRQNEPCCLALIDFDWFKNINDNYSHQLGDLVLSSVAHFILEKLRRYDKLFRYGGEEFLICLPFTDLQEGKEVAERLRSEIAELPIKLKQNESIKITVSVGLAMLDIDIPIETSIEYAVKAVNAAKEAGRNCIRIYDIKRIQ